MDVKELFEKHNDEHGEFDKIENKRSTRPDLHVFLLLDELFPSDNGSDIVSAAEHDQIWLDVSEEQMETLTEPQILELVRCGVFIDEGPSMFV
jgi:hypothetical protein